jgi:hypothetical protein
VCFVFWLCSPVMSSQGKDDQRSKMTKNGNQEEASEEAKPAATKTQQRNVKVGTLEDASDPNNQQNNKEG